MKLTEDFLSRELKDDEMMVINGGLSSNLTGGEWCGAACQGADGDACGLGCSATISKSSTTTSTTSTSSTNSTIK